MYGWGHHDGIMDNILWTLIFFSRALSKFQNGWHNIIYLQHKYLQDHKCVNKKKKKESVCNCKSTSNNKQKRKKKSTEFQDMGPRVTHISEPFISSVLFFFSRQINYLCVIIYRHKCDCYSKKKQTDIHMPIYMYCIYAHPDLVGGD